MQMVVETPTFSRQADKLFNEHERRELIELLATSPLAGDEIRGTGGVRKLRFAASGRGKLAGALKATRKEMKWARLAKN